MFDFFLASLMMVFAFDPSPITHAISAPPPKPAAIVFGAGLAPKKQPSVVLADRLDTAYDLYQKSLVSSILLSGDSVDPSHDEVGAMKAYLVRKGIPESSLLLDPKGVDTYSTCLHARNDFKLSRVILVTQAFHMPRAEYLCEGVGLAATYAVADKREYKPENAEREQRAMTKAWLQLNTSLSPDQLKLLEAIVE